MTLQLPVSFFIHTSLAFWRKYNGYMTTYGENSAKNDCFEDCISKLPDEILASILSHLTVKEAVRTRELSKRWRHLYLSYLHASGSNLNFNLSSVVGSIRPKYFDCKEYRSRFVKFVNNFLDQYKGPNIISFHVAFCLGRNSASDIDRWITYAVKLDVEELLISCTSQGCLTGKHDQLYVVSFQILSEASNLNYLLLDSCIIKPHFSGRFHSLKVLELFNISVNQILLLYILSRCSNLEQMRLSSCSCPTALSFRGPFLQLKLLTVSHCKGLMEIELSADHLTNFEFFTWDPTVNIVFSSVVSLKSVICSVRGNICCFFNKLANSLPQLQSLSVICSSSLIDIFPSCISTFGNLKQLKFFFTDTDWLCFSLDIREIIPFISACPTLQRFHLTISRIEKSWINNEDRSTKQYNKCLYTQLKEVEIDGFVCTKNQLELAIYLLENAIALERMVIRSGYKIYDEFEHWSDEDTFYPMDEDTLYPMDEKKREWLFQELQGKATSKSARVIIQ